MDAADKKLNQAELIVLLDGLAQDIIAKEEELRQLDAALGDGDLGITTRMGFKAVQAIFMSSKLKLTILGLCWERRELLLAMPMPLPWGR